MPVIAGSRSSKDKSSSSALSNPKDIELSDAEHSAAISDESGDDVESGLPDTEVLPFNAFHSSSLISKFILSLLCCLLNLSSQVPRCHSAEVKKEIRSIFPSLAVSEADVKKMFKTTETFNKCLHIVHNSEEFIR